MKRLIALMTACLLTLFTALAMAETTFAPLPIDATAGPEPDPGRYLPNGGGYEDESLSVRIETTTAYDTVVTIARVSVRDPSQVRTLMAARYGSKNTAAPDRLAQRGNAVLAINGDFFNYRSTGYLVRQGVLYRDRTDDTYDVLIIDDRGDLHIIKDPTPEAVHAFPGTVVNSFSFGPALVIDGEIVKTEKRLNVGVKKKTQRMAIGQTGPLEYLCVATEGPENKGSLGLTIEEIAQLMHDLGAYTAYNLDGGSSSAMVLGGKKINALSSGKMRPVCDMIYFATLIGGDGQ